MINNFDDKEFQILTVKNVPPFVSELFFEDIWRRYRACKSSGIASKIYKAETYGQILGGSN